MSVNTTIHFPHHKYSQTQTLHKFQVNLALKLPAYVEKYS